MSKKKKEQARQAELENQQLDENTEAAANASAAANDKEKEQALRDVLHIRRTAKEVKRYTVLMRVTGLIAVALVALIAIGYAIAYFYNKYGSFTIKVNKYDMVNQGLSLSETPDFDRTNSMLTADIVYDMTNISGNDLPDNIDKVNGNHNGKNYIAYTFYLHNSGNDTITYEGDLTISNVTKNVDEAIRVAVYTNGEKVVYGKTKSDGKGKESDCDKEFLTGTQVMHTQVEDFKKGDTTKYTVVIWLEGNDPDCLDNIIGGVIKLQMDFRIIENT